MKNHRKSQIIRLIILIHLIINSTGVYSQNIDTLYVSDEVYVKIKDNQPIQKASNKDISISSITFLQNALFNSMVLKVELPFYFSDNQKLLRTYRIKISKPNNIDTFIAGLKNDPSIEYIEKIPKMYFHDLPNDPFRSSQNFYFSVMQMNDVWQHYKFLSSAQSKVAVVDNAVQTAHQDLTTNYYSGSDVADGDSDPNPPNSNFSHGTHVAGIVGAVTNNSTGVSSIGNNIAKIIAVKSTYDSESGNFINARI